MSADPNNPTRLTSCANEIEAAAVIGALQDAGIDAQMVGGFTSGFRAEAPGDVEIVVRECDLDVAKKTLQKFQQAPPGQR